MAQSPTPVEYEILNGITATPPASDPSQTLPISTTPSVQNVSKDQLDILIRLVIGTGLIGAEELGQYLQKWEESARQQAADELTQREETKAAVVRYAILGAFFELKDKVELGLENLGKTTGTISHTISEKSRPVTQSRFYQPVQKKYNASRRLWRFKNQPIGRAWSQ